MKPVKTESTNLLLLPPKGQEHRVFDLWCTKIKGHSGEGWAAVESCWQMTWRERFKVLWHGQVWFHVWGETHPPIRLDVRDKIAAVEYLTGS